MFKSMNCKHSIEEAGKYYYAIIGVCGVKFADEQLRLPDTVVETIHFDVRMEILDYCMMSRRYYE